LTFLELCDTLTGTVKEVREKFAFIGCQTVLDSYGCDVFTPLQAVAGYNIGDSVDFDLMLNAKGQPQATNVRPHTAAPAEKYAWALGGGGGSLISSAISKGKSKGNDWSQGKGKVIAPPSWGQNAWDKGGGAQAWSGGGAQAWSGGSAQATGQSCSGTIKDIGATFCFISCSSVMAQYGKDVFTPAVAVMGKFNVGDTIDFDLQVNSKGQPQATNLRAGSGGGQSQLTGDCLTGLLKEVGTNFAFIECEPVMQMYGKDVFCPKAALEKNGFSVGEEVEFDLMINAKGMPQAGNARRPGSGAIANAGPGYRPGPY